MSCLSRWYSGGSFVSAGVAPRDLKKSRRLSGKARIWATRFRTPSVAPPGLDEDCALIRAPGAHAPGLNSCAPVGLGACLLRALGNGVRYRFSGHPRFPTPFPLWKKRCLTRFPELSEELRGKRVNLAVGCIPTPSPRLQEWRAGPSTAKWSLIAGPWV